MTRSRPAQLAPQKQPRAGRTTRCGFTLPELMIALCVLLLVTSTLVQVLARQQRFYRSVGEILAARASMRDGIDILSADLRTASVQDTLTLASDTAIEFVATTGASTLCSDPTVGRMVVPPDTLASGNVLTAWAAVPDSDDLVAVYHDSLAIAPVPGWQRYRVASVTSSSAVMCPSTARAYEITVSPAVTIAAARGAPVRFLRRARYSVYRAGDSKWYLGYRRCGATACAPIQPVSGPYNGAEASPLELRYYAKTGARIPTPTSTVQVTRIDIVLRAASRGGISVPGMPPGILHDSVLATVAPRNAL
ncbi:MAG: PilW family protein [Gemmatimonadaceae bacterium]